MNKLLIICAVVAFVLAASGQAQAQVPEVWVDDDFTWESGLAWCSRTITGGIAKVEEGGIVYVHEGTYTENVVIDKSITIEALSDPIIDGGGSLGPGVHITADDVTLDGFIIRNFTCTPSSGIGGIWVAGHRASINSNTIYDIVTTGDPINDPAGIGIDVGGVDDVVVSNNTIHDVGSIGIRIRGNYGNSSVQVTGTVVVGNEVYNTGNSGMLVAGNVKGIDIINNTIHDSLLPTPYGLLVIGDSAGLGGIVDTVLIEDNTIYNTYGNVTLGSVTNVTVTGNTIRNAIPYAADPTIKGKNIYIRNWSDELTTNVTITDNDIIDADGYGVFFKYGGSGDPSAMVSTTTVNDNRILGNTIGIENPIGTTLLDATHNWWGDASGPSGAGPGLGDAVSTNVDFYQWCLDIDCSDVEPPYGETAVVMVDDDWAGLSGGTIVYGSEIGLNAFATIQGGIGAVDEGGTVNVLAGTYIEDLVIDKNDVEIVAIGTTIKGVATEPWSSWPFANPNIDIQAKGVKISGFTIQSPDVPAGHYSSGIVLTGTNIEICDNTFVSNAAGDGGCVVIQTYRDNVTGYESDISGLNIHDNEFGGTLADGYVGVFINHTNVGAGAVTVKNNTLSDRVAQGVVTERSNTVIQGNTISNSDVAGYSRGIIVMDWDVREQDSVTMSDNTITGCQYGIRIGESEQVLTNISVTGNTLQNNDVGVHVRASAGGVVVNNNNITGNTTYGVQNTDAGIPGIPGIPCDPLDPNDPNSPCDPNGQPEVPEVPPVLPGVLDATLNWWGEVRGPYHATANPHGTGNEVSDNVEFVPWLDASYPDGQLYTNVFIDTNKNGVYDAGEPIFYIIQDAIDAAYDGDIIIVGAGVYYENLVIDKSGITLKSTKGRDTTTLSHQSSSEVGVDFRAGADYCVLGGEAGHGFTMVKDSAGCVIQLTNAPSGVEISDNTIDNTGASSVGINVDANGVDGLQVIKNEFIAEEGDSSIYGRSATNMIIFGNTFTGPGKVSGCAVQSDGMNASDIANNTIDGYGTGIFLQTVEESAGVSDVTISNNRVRDCVKGVRLGYDPEGYPEVRDVTVTDNELSFNTVGIYVSDSNDVVADTFVIKDNRITENTDGLKNANDVYVVDATLNWWGDPSGPSGEGSGSGDTVSVMVDYDPWWVCGDTVNPCPMGDLNHDDQVDFADFAIFADNWLEGATP